MLTYIIWRKYKIQSNENVVMQQLWNKDKLVKSFSESHPTNTHYKRCEVHFTSQCSWLPDDSGWCFFFLEPIQGDSGMRNIKFVTEILNMIWLKYKWTCVFESLRRNCRKRVKRILCFNYYVTLHVIFQTTTEHEAKKKETEAKKRKTRWRTALNT